MIIKDDENYFVVLTDSNYDEIGSKYKFKGYGYRKDAIGCLVEISCELDIKIHKKYRDVGINYSDVEKTGKNIIYYYGWPDMRMLMLSFSRYKEEMS